MKNNEEMLKKFPTMKSIGGVKAENGVSSKSSEEVKAETEKIDFSNVKIEPLFEEEVDFDTFSKSDFRAVKVKECVAVPKSKKLLQFTLDDGTGTDRTILSGIHTFYEPEELVGKTLIAITNLPPRAMMGIDSCGMLLSAIHEEEGEEKLHLLMVDDHIPAGNLLDGKERKAELLNSFDLVIADVPCSGLGIIRKKPDIRYKDPKPLENLPRVQAAILDNVADYVRPGGVLLYATCTLLGRENEGVVRAFLDKRRDFTLDGFQVSGPFLDTDTGMLTCWPHRHGTDGFFFARLRRKDDGNL